VEADHIRETAGTRVHNRKPPPLGRSSRLPLFGPVWLVAAVIAEVAQFLAMASAGGTRGARGATLGGLVAFRLLGRGSAFGCWHPTLDGGQADGRAESPGDWRWLVERGECAVQLRDGRSGDPVICIGTRVGTTPIGALGSYSHRKGVQS
jgi:hypothetical protein